MRVLPPPPLCPRAWERGASSAGLLGSSPHCMAVCAQVWGAVWWCPCFPLFVGQPAGCLAEHRAVSGATAAPVLWYPGHIVAPPFTPAFFSPILQSSQVPWLLAPKSDRNLPLPSPGPSWFPARCFLSHLPDSNVHVSGEKPRPRCSPAFCTSAWVISCPWWPCTSIAHVQLRAVGSAGGWV